jgi:cytochrome c
MIQHFRLLFILFLSVVLFSCNKRSGKPRILVFSKTAGFRHSSIPAGKVAIMKLGEQNGFLVDTTEDASYFVEDSLKNYSAVVFLNTTLNVLNNLQEADFQRYIQSGGGFVGVHAATDTEYDWGWYGRLVGGYFNGHPATQQAKLNVVDQTHISTKHLPKEWTRTDEWYNFKKLNKDVKVLITIDEKSYQGGTNGDTHPMAWYHEFDGGRSFYTELGHTDESFAEENYLKHLLGGIQYAIGDNNKLDYSKATTMRVPDEDRFNKVMLTQGTLFEPTEMAILPSLDVLIAQRRGEIMLYKKADSSIKQAGFLNVYWKTGTPGVNAEEGLLGIQADPDFKNNKFIYIFYSPIDTSVNRLSRFKFENDTIDPKSEKVVLQFYSQREICCHTGGSIAFGKDRILYVSTGDNSTPFDEGNQKYVNNGFAPLDDRKGHEQYDARRSSGNSNDLRGKILRIRVKEDGTYEIPEGNLFKGNDGKTKPEIYVMGNRNPYRISVDKRTGFLYWGEVGPDATDDSVQTRGPRGYDEVNQAREAGFFGWPLFVGNNYAYREFDYGTGKSGEQFVAEKPLNNSRNNTGLQQLPPAKPAFIWYPYAESKDFPQVGTGGRNAMAGPVYYTEDFPKESRLPDYYDKKLFIYDWIRGWVKAVTMLDNGDFDKMEPFMSQTKLNAPIDMEVGPDGKLYILEYGSGWFSKNPDAGLSRIDYNGGNRAPKVGELTVNKLSGSLPFTVRATVKATDPERKPLKYTWTLGKGNTKETDSASIEYVFDRAGEYEISVAVTDEENARSTSNSQVVYAGNETPQIAVQVQGNQSFYFPGKQVGYSVTVKDPDDAAMKLDTANLIVSADYVEGTDKAGASQGHQIMTDAMMGRSIMLSLDCKTCHQVDQKSIGPAYNAVATKYSKDPNAVPYLVEKIIKGGGGVWGETAMAAHPDLKEADARKIVSWILSLSEQGKKNKSLPVSGSVNATMNKPAKPNGVLYISASYTDRPRSGLKAMTGSSSFALRSNQMSLDGVTNLEKFAPLDYNDRRILVTPKERGWFSIDSIDLTGVNNISLALGWSAPPVEGYKYELRLDSPDGELLGSLTLPGAKGTKEGGKEIQTAIKPVADGRFHKVFVIGTAVNPKEPNTAAVLSVTFKP